VSILSHDAEALLELLGLQPIMLKAK